MSRCTEWRGDHAAVVDNHVNYIDLLARYEDEEEDGRLLHLPVPLGAPVFVVYDKCNPGYLDCPYDGGYGTSRCTDRKCKAYYKETEFDLTLLNYLGVTVFLSEIDAQDAVERMNNK